ncbi:lecithin retinol acyltransferase family protein [Nocardioides sp. SR21]|uniref:lecithin retinol acyltransferase family protein n=1 Tax=Nocardioides sp. SR21 TaxID=2919501 RepID=UPI001FAAA7E9|nr:lecithin retinol acyltransferase family protein [Nocardioides sp. SR21]
MASGDHLVVRRGLRYSHHGIDCGDGSVIHHIRESRKLRVARTSLEEFAAGSRVRVRTYAGRLSAEDAVRNAESRLGSTDYSLVRNNCEHFAAWCSTGRARSAQVRRWVLLQGAVVAALLVGAVLGRTV